MSANTRAVVEAEAAAAAAREAQLQARINTLLLVTTQQNAHAGAQGGAKPTSLLDRYKRLRPNDLPQLEGTESAAKIEAWLEDWLTLCELNDMAEADSVTLAAARFVGTAKEWWRALPAAEKGTAGDRAGLAAAVRARFVPLPTAEQAMRELLALRQGTRTVTAYIADFTRLRTLAGSSLADGTARFVFQEGLRADLRKDVAMARVKTLQEAVAVATTAGALVAHATHTQAPGPPASLKHMQADEQYDAHSQRMEQLERVMQEQINALHMQQQQQPQQRYPRGGRSGGGGRGGGGRGGRQQLPEALVEQRRKDGVCLKCGDKSHFARGCRNEPRL
jgi:hypothetical protein